MADYIDKIVGINFKTASPYKSSDLMTKAQMLADSYGYNGKYTICYEDKELYIYNDTKEVSATTGNYHKFEVGDSIQVSTMPTPSSTITGKIVQYIGETTTTEPIYTNGYFYICEENPMSAGNYHWNAKNVQEGGGKVFTDATTDPERPYDEQTIYRIAGSNTDTNVYSYKDKPTQWYAGSAYWRSNWQEDASSFKCERGSVVGTSSVINWEVWDTISLDDLKGYPTCTKQANIAKFCSIEEGYSPLHQVISFTRSGENGACIIADYTGTPYTLKYAKSNMLYSLGSGGSSATINNVEVSGTQTSESLNIVWAGTKADYDAITTKNISTIYLITDDFTPSDVSWYSKSEVDALLLTKQAASSNSLQTNAKEIVSAINENFTNIKALVGGVSIKVVATQPTTPVNNTIYYIGTAAPYTIKIYTADAGWTNLGTSSVDMSDYQKKAYVNTSYTAQQIESILEEIKTLLDAKVLKSNILTAQKTTATDDELYSAKYVEANYILKSNMYKVGDVYETLSTSETTSTLATRFGGTWEALADRIEDTFKQVSFAYTAMNSFSPKGSDSTSAFKLYGRVVDANYVELLWNGYFWGTLSNSSETQLASNVKINNVLINRPIIIRCISSDNAIYHTHCYISGAGKLWLGANLAGYKQYAVNSSNYIEKSLINLTPDRTFKRFKRNS